MNRLSVLLLLNFILVWNGIVEAAPSCRKIFKKEATSIWDKTRLEIPGTSRAVTFAFDSEIGVGTALKILRAHSTTSSKVEEILSRTRVSKLILLKASDLSENQFAFFGLRKGVNSDQKSFTLNDLSNALIQKLWLKSEDRSFVGSALDSRMEELNPQLIKLFQLVFETEKKPFEVELDETSLEIRHQSLETSPEGYRKLIENFHRKFPGAQTHFHIGIPNDVPRQALIAIGRAVEAKIILRLVEDNSGGTLALNIGSMLDRGALSSFKGVIGLEAERFNEPWPSHDLEIRQHLSLSTAFEDLSLAALLAMENQKLLRVDENIFPVASRRVKDPQNGNVVGAFRFIGEILQTQKDPALQVLGKEMLALIERVGQPNNWSAKTREELSEFLRQNEIVDRIQAEIFLVD